MAEKVHSHNFAGNWSVLITFAGREYVSANPKTGLERQDQTSGN